MRAVWLVLLVAGCSGLKTYPSDPSGNLQARAMLDSGVKAMLHVHRVDPRCQTEYAGSVALGAQPVTLAVPSPAYLVVSFDTSSFLGGQRGTSTGALLRPRAGERYQLGASYRNDLYELVIRTASGREVPLQDLAACRG
jgi:hypothetical protein